MVPVEEEGPPISTPFFPLLISFNNLFNIIEYVDGMFLNLFLHTVKHPPIYIIKA